MLRLLLVQAVFGVGTWMGEGEEGDGIGMGLAKGVEVRGVRGAGGDGLGRRLVALRPFCAGDTVACSAPMVRAVNDVHRQVVCHGCLDVLPSTVVRCKGCAVGYCSMECARGAKREHKAECAAVRALENAGIADGRGLCLFASLLDRARRGEKTRKRGGGDDEFSAFLELQAEVGDEVKSAEYAKTARGLAPLVGLEDDDGGEVAYLASLIARAHTNLHGIVDRRGRLVGSGVYVMPSYLNHSCAPNCVTSFGAGGRLRVVAVRPVSEGEDLCIAYADVLASRETRRVCLERAKHFFCECGRCVAPPARDATLTAWRDPGRADAELLRSWVSERVHLEALGRQGERVGPRFRALIDAMERQLMPHHEQLCRAHQGLWQSESSGEQGEQDPGDARADGDLVDVYVSLDHCLEAVEALCPGAWHPQGATLLAKLSECLVQRTLHALETGALAHLPGAARRSVVEELVREARMCLVRSELRAAWTRGDQDYARLPRSPAAKRAHALCALVATARQGK